MHIVTARPRLPVVTPRCKKSLEHLHGFRINFATCMG